MLLKIIEFKVHRNDAITNIRIKPNSSIDPNITKSVFKSFLQRGHILCSEKYIKEEAYFSVDIFVTNGHKRTFLEAFIKYYNAKQKTNDSRNYINSKATPRLFNIVRR